MDNIAPGKFSPARPPLGYAVFPLFAEWSSREIMPTMLYQRVRDLLIVAHSADDPSPSEWSKYTRSIQAAQRSDTPLTGILVTTLGGTPNPKQRAAVLAAIGAQAVVTCVCTNSLLARGVLTAMSWIGKHPMHAFPLLDVDRALEALGASPELRQEAKGALAQLQAQLIRAA
jgi:hypothetical protein